MDQTPKPITVIQWAAIGYQAFEHAQMLETLAAVAWDTRSMSYVYINIHCKLQYINICTYIADFDVPKGPLYVYVCMYYCIYI